MLSNEDFRRILICATEAGVSDVNIVPGQPVFWRRGGQLIPLREYVPSSEDTKRILEAIGNDWAVLQFKHCRRATFAWQMQEWRYRCQAYRINGAVALSFRVLQRMIPPPEELGTASIIITECLGKKSGLVIIAGGPGSGKSLTAASFLQAINTCEEKHILTFENPVEYQLPKGKSLVTQLEAWDFLEDEFLSTITFTGADVVMAPEVKKAEHLMGIIKAAESRLVILQVRESSVVGVLRLFGWEITDYHDSDNLYARLAKVLLGIQVQKLVPDDLGAFHSIVEYLPNNEDSNWLIEQGDYACIENRLSRNEYGSISMKASYDELVEGMPNMFNHETSNPSAKKEDC